jgi:exopolysaccharide biosynthesis polyprenyl glycosylphosphotransferase
MHTVSSGPDDDRGIAEGTGAVTDLSDNAVGIDEGSPGAGLFEHPPRNEIDGSKDGGRGSLRRHLVVSDASAVIAAWVPLAVLAPSDHRSRVIVCAAVAVTSTMVAMQRAQLYRPHVCALPSREAVRLVTSALIGALAFGVCGFVLDLERTGIALKGAAIASVLLLALRWRFNRWLKGRRSAGLHLRTALLVGTTDEGVALWTMLNDEPELGYRVVGVIGEERHSAPWEGLPQCPEVDGIAVLAQCTGAVGVIIVPGALSSDSTTTAVRVAHAAGLHVQLWPEFMGLSSRRIQFAPVSGLPVFSVEPRAVAAWQRVIKRVVDVAVSVALAPFVVPVLLAAATCIKLEDRGPVLHHHAVVGRNGVPMTVLKLRTMVPNASRMMADVAAINERTGGPLFKATNDPRVTRVGRLLRATSIDELPQLWDVMTGKMSLVGPRFALPHEVAHFDSELRRRHEMRPGITGLWQTEARDNPSFSAYRRLDLLYVDNWSLSLDLTILANTAHAVSVRALRAVVPVLHREQREPAAAKLAVSSLAVQAMARVEAASPE